MSVTKSSRKGKIDLKIKMDHADGLMRKMWSQLERPCREEGVKRYQLEASSQVTPPKMKHQTGLEKARAKVTIILKMEAERRAKDKKYTESRATKEAQVQVENTEKDISGNNSTCQKQEDLEILHEAEKLRDINEEGGAQLSEMVSSSGKEALAKEHCPEQDPPKGKDLTKVNIKEKSTKEEGEKIRVKKQRWIPEAGFRRCGLKCPGCAEKCAEQGIEDC